MNHLFLTPILVMIIFTFTGIVISSCDFNKNASSWLRFIISTIQAGNKAHGVVVSKDGTTVYVTNSIDNTVSMIDVATQKLTRTVPVVV